MARIQVVIGEAEREAFRAQAVAEGKSLSEWLRDAGRQRLAESAQPRLASADDVRAFFDELDAERRATGDDAPEQDWEHVKERLAAERSRQLDPLGLDP